MARVRSVYALPAALAALAVTIVGWLSLTGYAWSDYDDEARTAVDALVAGDVHGFLVNSPIYGGSLLIRAPFALVPSMWGGGELAIYRALAAPCLIAAALLAAFVAGRMRAAKAGPVAWGTALLVLAGNPITLRALEMGHPEELLVSVMCIGAVLLAAARRPVPAAVLIGVAVAAKPWALLAVPAVILLADGRRVRTMAIALAAAAVVVAPFAVADAGSVRQKTTAAGATSQIFQPWQVFWFAGSSGHVVRGIDGTVKPGYRQAPGWLSGVTRPLILLMAPALALLMWRRRGPAGFDDVLLLLGLTFVLRCLLDPWNSIYYAIPAIFAIATWEGAVRRRVPAVSLVVSVLVWLTFKWLPDRAPADAQSLIYLAWTVPLVAGLGLRLLAPARFAALAERGARAGGAAGDPAPVG